MYKDANVAHGLLPYDGTIEDSVKRLAPLPLLFSPGEKWEYSLGVDVLGRLVEVMSGKSLDEFLRVRVFEPLGMKDTYFYPPENKLDRLAAAYTYYTGKGLNRFPGRAHRGGTDGLFGRLPVYAAPGSFFPAAAGWYPRPPITRASAR